VALKEPEFVNALLFRLATERNPNSKDRLGALVALLLRSLSHGVRFDTDGCERVNVVKLSSWNAMLADEFVWRLAPIPLVVVTRDPWATVTSFLHDPPHWYSPPPAPSTDRSSAPANRMEAARFFAEAWSRTVEGALRLPPRLTLFVNYGELVDDPLSVLVRVCRHLGNECESPNVESVAKITGQYSKAAREERFEPRGRHHRDALEAEVKDLVTTITARSWSALLKRTLPTHFHLV